jgi:cytochrome c-type biogenesis protein
MDTGRILLTDPSDGTESTSSRIRLGAGQTLAAIASVVIALLIASSWLVFPYFIKEANLIASVGTDVKQERLQHAISIGKFLNRTSFGTGEAQVDVLYATPKFFELTDRSSVVSQYRPDLYHVFLSTETTHIDDLPTILPEATLFIDGREYSSVDVEGPLEVYHHRAASIRFPAYHKDGTPVISDSAREVRLELVSSWDPGNAVRQFAWNLPIEYPAELLNPSPWTPAMVIGLSAGLLSFVLTPCLLQLLAIYVVTLTGFSADRLGSGGQQLPAEAKRKLFLVALSFVAGFSGLFTLTGAAIGLAGKQMQMFFAVWSPTMSVIAGAVVIAMGLWVGIRSRAPLVCRVVPASFREGLSKPSSYLGSAIVAVGFSLGCLTCFGGAIIATLLIYVGALGSALVGAMVMFAFSLGVAIPFLLAAVFLIRTLPLLSRIQRLAPWIGFVSMLTIVAFGLVLITDNFHTLSDFIYPYLGLN